MPYNAISILIGIGKTNWQRNCGRTVGLHFFLFGDSTLISGKASVSDGHKEQFYLICQKPLGTSQKEQLRHLHLTERSFD